MTVILVLFTFIMFLLLDAVKTWHDKRLLVYKPQRRSTIFTTPGFEMLGALAQDGGKIYEKHLADLKAAEAKKAEIKTPTQPTASC